MKHLTLLLLILFTPMILLGQDYFSVSFSKDTIEIGREKKKPIIVSIQVGLDQKVSEDLAETLLTVVVNNTNTNMPSSSYEINFSPVKFSDLKEKRNLFFTVYPDSLPDRERTVSLEFQIVKDGEDISTKNSSNRKSIIFKIPEIKQDFNQHDSYSLLSYLGTNFDLVDGVKAKNLFFATNIFADPKRNNSKFGFYFSLYGNRTFSETDTLKDFSRSFSRIPTSDTTYLSIKMRGDYFMEVVSDNIGAQFNVLIQIGEKNKSKIDLYYSPSLEIIWRRKSGKEYFIGETSLDSATVSGNLRSPIIFDVNRSIRTSEFVTQFGLIGFFLVMESDKASFRMQTSSGIAGKYLLSTSSIDPSTNLAFSGEFDFFYNFKGWLTEPVTGITLQMEITNYIKNPQPYFGVTLSKAFKLSEISSIFTPLTTRTP